jgi:integrase
VEDHLLEQNLSNSCRNTIIYTLKLILREALREELIDMVPEFEPFKRNGRKQDVLSGEELQSLFPEDQQELIRIWRRPAAMKKEPDEIALMFGTLFCVAVSAGLRSGEIRSLHREQLSLPHSGLVIDRAIDEMGHIGALKKATADDPRSRAVVIPEISMRMLLRWLEIAPDCPDYPGLVFSYRNKPVANYYILDRFRFGLDRLGIDYVTRRLTVHCLRYTALGMKTPEAVHTWSSREYPRMVRDWDYEHGMDPKMVTVNGAIRWKDEGFVMVSSALGGKYVGLQPVQDGV